MIKLDGEHFRIQRDPKQMNTLALAYIGDTIYDLFIRHYLLAQGEIKPHLLHRLATTFVSAKAQAIQLEKIIEQLDEEEKAIVRRGRNAKSGSIPKNASPADYQKATAFEALLGFLYLMERRDRLAEIINMGIQEINQVKKEAK